MDIVRYRFNAPNPLIEVKPLDFIWAARDMTERTHRAEFHMILYVETGVLSLELDFEPMQLRDRSVLYIAPGQVCRFDSRGTYAGWAILFTDELISQRDNLHAWLHTRPAFYPWGRRSSLAVVDDQLPTLCTLLAYQAQQETEASQREILRTYTYLILLLLDRMTSGAQPAVGRSALVERFCMEVEQHFTHRHNVADYLRTMGIQEKTLSRAVAQHLGLLPKAYIDQRRILEAKRLLAYGAMSVKEIAFALGFDEPTNFNKFFRKHTGSSPLSFRLLHQG